MSLPQIIQKENGDFQVMVHCKKMTRVHISYDCPFCYTLNSRRVISKSEQLEKKYKSAKPTVHRHGTARNYNNGLRGGTCSHCEFNKCDVIMVIDDNTIKQL